MSQQPDPSLQRLWLRQLHQHWEHFNQRYLSGRLRPPVFALDARTTRLGAWEPLTRTLSISTAHLWRDTWVEVSLTLRHEMAHQVVSELFQAPAAEAHGHLFRRAARMLDLTHSPRQAPEPEPRVAGALDKIRKLFNLSRSPNVHEAQAAMAAANRLLLKLNLSRRDLETDPDNYRFRWLGEPRSRIPLERKILASLLQHHFFVQTIWIGTARARDNQPVRQLEVLGEPHNLDIAEYVHDYLGTTLDRFWRDFRRDLPPGAGRRARHDYRVGVMMGFRDHLDSQRQHTAADGLIWLGDTRLDELFAQRYPRVGRLAGGHYRPGEAHRAGLRDGRRIRINPGLDRPPVARGHQIE